MDLLAAVGVQTACTPVTAGFHQHTHSRGDQQQELGRGHAAAWVNRQLELSPEMQELIKNRRYDGNSLCTALVALALGVHFRGYRVSPRRQIQQWGL